LSDLYRGGQCVKEVPAAGSVTSRCQRDQPLLQAYDGLGLAAQFNGSNLSLTSSFQYDGEQMVQAVSGTGAVQWEAAWGPGIDSLLEWVDVAGGTGRHLPLLDSRNAVTAFWNEQTSALSSTAEYNAEGRVLLRAPDGTVSCAEVGSGTTCPLPAGGPFGFSSAWRSSVTGLVSMRARWYSPQLGEFLSQDEAGYGDSFNLYGYVGFDPVNRWDPSGSVWLGSKDTHIGPPLRNIGLTPTGSSVLADLEDSPITFSIYPGRLPDPRALGLTGNDPKQGINDREFQYKDGLAVIIAIDTEKTESPRQYDKTKLFADYVNQLPDNPSDRDIQAALLLLESARLQVRENSTSFTIAHELGHALVFDFGVPNSQEEEDFASELARQIEWEMGQIGKHQPAFSPAPHNRLRLPETWGQRHKPPGEIPHEIPTPANLHRSRGSTMCSKSMGCP
jgi:RHS repeat-associated protein